jgi:hypothetical protein
MFWKRRGMIDVGKMASQGKIKVPKREHDIQTNKEGFVEISSQGEEGNIPQKKESSGFFDFLGFNSSESKSENNSSSNFSSESNGYSKREVDSKMEEFDNKIYKLEQRIELLERKTGVSSTW